MGLAAQLRTGDDRERRDVEQPQTFPNGLDNALWLQRSRVSGQFISEFDFDAARTGGAGGGQVDELAVNLAPPGVRGRPGMPPSGLTRNSPRV